MKDFFSDTNKNYTLIPYDIRFPIDGNMGNYKK